MVGSTKKIKLSFDKRREAHNIAFAIAKAKKCDLIIISELNVKKVKDRKFIMDKKLMWRYKYSTETWR